MVQNVDSVINMNDLFIGFFISYTIDGVRFILGQAYVGLKHAKVDTLIGIHQGGNMERPARMAKVVSRFAKL